MNKNLGGTLKSSPLLNKYSFNIKGYNPLLISGVNNSFLKLLKEHIGKKIILRGNNIILFTDDTKDKEKLEKFLEIIENKIKKNKYIDEADIIMAMAKSNILKNTDIKIIVTPKRKVYPKTKGQSLYIEAIEKNDIVIGIGPAGTGKTFLAVAMAVKYLMEKKVERIFLTRPAVEAGESLGFLPGTYEEKINPYLAPLYDALFQLLHFDKVKKLMENRIIEIVPLAYMRGRTLSNAFIILDEAQNTTYLQMKMFLTRLGVNSKVVITGDVSQIDLPPGVDSGLVSAEKILKNVEGVKFVYFTKDDVVRHPLVKKLIEAYEKYEQGRNS